MSRVVLLLCCFVVVLALFIDLLTDQVQPLSRLKETDTNPHCTNWHKDNETFFKVKRSTRMSKVINAFASRKGIAASSVVCFTQTHHRVEEQETPLYVNRWLLHMLVVLVVQIQ